MNRKQLLAVACLFTAMLVAVSGAGVTYNRAQAADFRAEDLARARAVEKDRRSAAQAAERKLQAAVSAALEEQKAHDRRVLKRVIRKLKAAERRRVDAAYRKGQRSGYASGNAAGYSSGVDAGYDEGLLEGSDELDCSDDPDVTWLPACF